MYLPTKEFLLMYAPIRKLDFNSDIKIHYADDFFNLWHSLEVQTKKVCDVPFWAIAWPAARVLCNFISRNPQIVKDKSILDLGCGCGVVGIVAKKYGALSVTFNDVDLLSIYVSNVNAEINEIACESKIGDLTSTHDQTIFDIIFTADLFYEKHSSNRMYEFLVNSKKNGSEIIIADGHRPFTPNNTTTIISKETLDVDFNVEGVHKRDVNILRLS